MLTGTRIASHWIDICYPDYLSDHHNRDNELLICAPATLDKEALIEDLFSSATQTDKIPAEISNEEIKTAIARVVNRLSEYDFPEDSEDECCEFYAYAYLSW